MAIPKTNGGRADYLYDLREKIRAQNKVLDQLKAQYNELDEELKEALITDGSDAVSGKKATYSIRDEEVPSVEDWDDYFAYIRRNNYFFLLQRRTNAAPYRELMVQRRGRPIPGVRTVTLKKSNLTVRRNA